MSEGVCMDGIHAYPKVYAGNPEYAERFFSGCLCGKKRKVTTVAEIDVVEVFGPTPKPIKKEKP